MSDHLKQLYCITLTLLCVAVLTASQSFACQTTPSDEATELKAIAERLLSEPKALQEIRPTWEQAFEIAKSPKDATIIFIAAVRQFEAIREEGWQPVPSFDKVVVEECKTREFAGSEILERLTSQKLYTVKYYDVENLAFRANVFAKINDRWAYFHNPWQALKESDSYDTHLGSLFVQMLSAELYEHAYEMSAPVVQELMSLEEFTTFHSELGFEAVDFVTWTSTSRERRNSEQVLIYEGKLAYLNGTNAEIKLTLIFTPNTGARPYQMEITRLIGASHSYALVPTMERCREVFQQNIMAFVDAIKKNDFTEFRESRLGFEIRENSTPESIKNAFSAFLDADTSFLKDAELSFSQRPKYSEKNRGSVIMEGAFRNPQVGKVWRFTMRTTEETADRWLMHEFNAYPIREYDSAQQVPKMDNDAILALADESARRFVKAMKSGDFGPVHEQFSDSFKKQLSKDSLEDIFANLKSLFEPDALFHDETSIDISLRTTPSLDQDFLQVSVVISEPGDEWIQGDIDYVYIDNQWQVLRIKYNY